MPASGFLHQDVLFGPEKGSVDPNIAPTDTVLAGPYDIRVYAMLSGYLKNPDATQVIQGRAETSWDGSTNWAPVPAWYDFTDIQPGEVRSWLLDVTPYRWVRFIGTASGAGIVAAPFYVLRTSGMAVRHSTHQLF